MRLVLIKEQNGKKFVEELEREYGSLGKLQRLLQEHPDDNLYKLDYHDWLYNLRHPDEIIKTMEVVYLKDESIKLSDLNILDAIKNKKPKSIRNLSQVMHKDLSHTQNIVKRLTEEGLIRLEEGPKNSKIPIVNYDKIEIEI